MGLSVGARTVTDVHVGSTPVNAVYRGSSLLWTRAEWQPPASDLTNTCNGDTGTEMTLESSALSGDPFTQVNAGWVYLAGGGVRSPAATATSLFSWGPGVEAEPALPSVEQSVGFWFTLLVDANGGRFFDARNGSNTATFGGLTTQAGGVRAMAGTTGVAASQSPPLVIGRPYWITYGIDNSVSGSHTMLIQLADGTTFHQWTGALAGTGEDIGYRRFGKIVSNAYQCALATVKASSGTATGLPLVPP